MCTVVYPRVLYVHRGIPRVYKGGIAQVVYKGGIAQRGICPGGYSPGWYMHRWV